MEAVVYEEDVEPVLDELKQLGFEVIDRKEHDTYKVMVCLASWQKILDGPIEWPGSRIPVVPDGR